MKKRILSILLTLCMVLSIAPAAVFAEGSTAPADITGEGTAENPYLIYTAAGLKAFRDKVNAGETGAHAKLMADIVLNDGTFDADGNYTPGASGKAAVEWTPIVYYKGTFDGNGHTVEGLYVKDVQHAGLFEGLQGGGTVKNVAVTGYVSGNFAGGIAGYMLLSSIISNCLNYCTVTGSVYAGGIAGSSDTMISSCGNRGLVSGSSDVGGIAGRHGPGQSITNCYNTGSVSGSGSWIRVGGIVGGAESQTRIANCYNTGSVSGSDIEEPCIGGIAGNSGDTTIANCYNAGQVSSTDGTGYIGGIVGWQRNGTVSNCYYPMGVADNGIGFTDYSPTVTNTEAKSKSDFANGTVLNLLKNGDENSPWAKNGYVSYAKMTLPLLYWQNADGHTHSYEIKHNDTEHWKECYCGVIETNSTAAHSGTDDGDCTTAVTCVCGATVKAAETTHNWGAWISDGNDTHTHKCQSAGCTASETDNCSGGTATCKDKAKCSACGEKYGELNANNHTGLKHIDAKAATHMSEGNIEYWYCSGCEKYFGDEAGTKEITLADTVMAKLADHTADTSKWEYDEVNHWNRCECGEKLNNAEHVYEWVTDKETTESEAGVKHEECSVCHAKRNENTEIPKIPTKWEKIKACFVGIYKKIIKWISDIINTVC